MFEESRSVGCQMDTKQTNETQMFEESRSVLTPERLSSNQDMLKFYTGIPNWIIFSALLKLVTPALPVMPRSKLTTFEMIMMFLIKIRLNLFDEDIAYRFSCHRTKVSRTFHKFLDVMAAKTAHLIKWPDRETLRETMPSSFRNFFLNVV